MLKYIYVILFISAITLSAVDVHINKERNNQLLGADATVENVIVSRFGGKVRVIHSYTYNTAGDIIETLSSRLYLDGKTPLERISRTFNDNHSELNVLAEKYKDGQWVNYYRVSKTYDKDNHLLTYLWEYWKNNNWKKTANVIFTYDANGNLKTKVDWVLVDGKYEGEYRTIYEYDKWNNVITHQRILVSDGKTTYFYKTVSTRLKTGEIVSYIYMKRDGSKWVNKYKTENKFNLAKKISLSYSYNWKNSKWELSGRTQYSYLKLVYLTQKLTQELDVSTWVNARRTKYTYNSKFLITSETFDYGANLGHYKYTTWTYDDKDRVVSELYQRWDNNNWNAQTRLTYKYNSMGFVVNKHKSTWDTFKWGNSKDYTLKFSDSKKREFEFTGYDISIKYKNTSDVDDDRYTVNTLTIYPNPTSDFLYISGEELQGKYSIYGIDGSVLIPYRQIPEQNGNTKIDISSLSAGFYLLRIETKTGIQTKPFIISK